MERSKKEIKDDIFFAVYSFLCDVAELRDWIRDSGLEHTSGKMDLTVTSLLTNTDIQPS